MKMLKKMAALLLVGVMALALLTACGDEAPSKSFAQQVEETGRKQNRSDQYGRWHL